MTQTLAPPPLDLTQCEAEPIHLPGAIQPHGCLLALEGLRRRIVQASANCLHQADDLVVLELEPAPAAPAALGALLTQAVRGSSAIHTETELPAKLQGAAELFRRLTGYDRVMIYRFGAGWGERRLLGLERRLRRPVGQPALGADAGL